MRENRLPKWAEKIAEKTDNTLRDLLYVPRRPMMVVAGMIAYVSGKPVEEVARELEKSRSDARLRLVLLIKYAAGDVDFPLRLFLWHKDIFRPDDLKRDGKKIEVLTALERLVSGFFPRRLVFYGKRWHTVLSQAFQIQRGDASFEVAWQQLAQPALFMAIRNMPGSTALGEIYPLVWREVRKEIERTLLHGQTLDQYLGRDEAEWPADDSPEALALEAALAEDLGELADLRIDELAALQNLPQTQAKALLAPTLGVEDSELAATDDVTQAAIRKRRQRGKRKIREILGE